MLICKYVVEDHLHTHRGAQGEKGKKGSAGKTLTWILSQEASTPQWLISTHGEEQSGGTPKTSSEQCSLMMAPPKAATGHCQPQHPPVR